MRLKCRMKLPAFALDIDVEFEARVTSIFGPSGAGKTSILDAIAGLRPLIAGEIEIGGTLLYSSDARVNLSPQARSVGYVPQEAALFPHLTVRKNLLFGERRENGSRVGESISLEHVTTLLQIGHLLNRSVTGLSGGECQRVALARAILSRPRLLLLDEPMASLDIGLKERIIPYLRRVRDEFAIPIIYVTHNPIEVQSLADWVIVIREGRLVTQGAPREALMSSRVLPYLERDQLENVFNARLIQSDAQGGRSRVRLEEGTELLIPYVDAQPEENLQIGVRSDDILVATAGLEGISASNVLPGVVRTVEELDGQSMLKIDAGSTFYVRLTSSAAKKMNLRENMEVFLVIKARSCLLL